MFPHMPGLMPMMIVIVLLVVLFGPSRLPDAARSIAQASKEFKKGLKEDPEEHRPALKGETDDAAATR